MCLCACVCVVNCVSVFVLEYNLVFVCWTCVFVTWYAPTIHKIHPPSKRCTMERKKERKNNNDGSSGSSSSNGTRLREEPENANHYWGKLSIDWPYSISREWFVESNGKNYPNPISSFVCMLSFFSSLSLAFSLPLLLLWFTVIGTVGCFCRCCFCRTSARNRQQQQQNLK